MAFISFGAPLCTSANASRFSGLSVNRRAGVITSKPVRFVRWTCLTSNDVKPGTTIELDGIVFRVNEFLHVKPGKGAAFVRTKLKNMKTGNVVDKTFRAGESLKSAQLDK